MPDSRSDTNRRVARLTINRGSAAVSIRVLGALLTFVAQVVLARLLGIAEFGVYAFVVGAINLGVAVARFGLDTVALRFAAVCVANKDSGLYRGLRRFSDVVVLPGAVVVALVLTVFLAHSAPWGERDSTLLTLVVMPGVVFLSLAALRTSSLLAFGKVVLAYLPELLLRPVLLAAGALAVLRVFGQVEVEQVLLVFAASATLSLAVSSLSLRRNIPPALGAVAARRYAVRDWGDAGMTFLVSTVGYFVLTQADILIVGVLLGDEAVGAYSAAARCSVYLTLFLIAVQRTVAPIISKHYASEDLAGTQQVLDVVATVAGLSGALGGVALYLLAEPIMGLFGADFVNAAVLLKILAAGQVVNCLTGASGIAMNMTGHHRSALMIQLGFAAIGVVASVAAAKLAGVVGVAVVTAATISGWNIVTAWYLRRRTGLTSWIRPSAMTLSLAALRD